MNLIPTTGDAEKDAEIARKGEGFPVIYSDENCLLYVQFDDEGDDGQHNEPKNVIWYVASRIL